MYHVRLFHCSATSSGSIREMACLASVKGKPDHQEKSCSSGGMTAEIGRSQVGQCFFFRQFGSERDPFIQKGVGVLPSTAFSAANNAFGLGT